MFHIVVYDIAVDARRVKLAHALEDFGTRVQWSVFECLLTESQLTAMMARITPLVDVATDSLRVYRLCGACEQVVSVIGRTAVTRDPEVYIL